MNKKGFANVALIVLILLIIGAVGYFGFVKKSIPVVNETVNMKTYTDSQYGFEIKYPPIYQTRDNLVKEPFYKEAISKIVGFTYKDNYIDDSTFSVYADNNSSNLSTCLKDYDGKDLTDTREINGNIFYIYFSKVNDSAMGGARGYSSQYRIIRNNYCYILGYHIYWHEVGYPDVNSTTTLQEAQAQNDDIKTHSDLLDQILSTFKFTK